MKLVSVSEMRQIEQEADASGLSYEQMMENAGRHLAEVVAERYDWLDEPSALGLVGSGNNGGDTLVALAHLADWGWHASAYIVRPREKDDPLVERLKAAGGEILSIEADPNFELLKEALKQYWVILDGVLGTGIKLPLKGEVATVLKVVKETLQTLDEPPEVVAVDVPSGIDSDSGEAAPETIPADLTVTMAAIKRGLLSLPAYDLLGELRLAGIGLSDEQPLKAWSDVKREVVDEAWVQEVLPPRPRDAHKGTFGTALIAAGSVNFTGAALLAGEAAYRVGAGLVTLAVPAPLHLALAGQFPEATWVLLPNDMGVISDAAAQVLCKNLERVTALLVGPGLGQEDTTRDFIKDLLGAQNRVRRTRIGFFNSEENVEKPEEKKVVLPPMVMDADGLKLLAQLNDWPKLLPEKTILTPHPGEMAIISGEDKDAIQADRIGTAEKFSAQWGHIVVLKGAFTVVAAPDGRTAVIPVASAALARAGTGDVLAGVITGLRAQDLDAFEAAAAGAWIHAQAGLRAAETIGNSASVLAGDVLASVMDVLSDLALIS